MMNALRQARIELGWSQSRLIAELQKQARSLGATLPSAKSLKTQVSRWENGHRTPDAFHQRLFAMAYRRGRVFNLTLLAHSHAERGAIDEACAVGKEAATAAAGMNSHRVVTRHEPSCCSVIATRLRRSVIRSASPVTVADHLADECRASVDAIRPRHRASTISRYRPSSITRDKTAASAVVLNQEMLNDFCVR